MTSLQSVDTVAQVVTLVLAVLGVVVSAAALWVNRRNAQDAAAAAALAATAKTRADEQTTAHTELVDALDAQGKLIDRYRQQVDDTRRELATQARVIEGQRRRMMELVKEHRECQRNLTKMETRVQLAEARIAELGG